MKLIIMMAIYLAVELLGLAILYGPLRKCLDPEHRYVGRAVIPVVIIGIIFLFPMIGALVPDQNESYVETVNLADTHTYIQQRLE